MFVVPEIIATAFGWIGALSAVSAYGAVTAKRISADSVTFQALNLVGAALLSVSASAHGAWPSAIVNVVWVAIGAFALRAIWWDRRPQRTSAILLAAHPQTPAHAHVAIDEYGIALGVGDASGITDRNTVAVAA